MTKRQDETSYRETAFDIIPRSKLIPLEIEGIKRAWDFALEKRKIAEIRGLASKERRFYNDLMP